MESNRLIINFSNPKEMIVPGFEKTREKSKFYFYPPNNISGESWYNIFEKNEHLLFVLVKYN